MNKVFSIFVFTCILVVGLKANEEKILEASNSLQLMTREYKNSIPKQLIKKSHAIAIFPSVTKVGFLIGGLYGEGVISLRKSNGWSSPYMASMKGGSLGFQFGFESNDIVLFILNSSIAHEMIKGKFTLGTDMSVSAGPTGDSISQMTDFTFSDDIYAYVINNGLFAGVSLGGASINTHNEAEEKKDTFATRVFIETLKRLEQ